MQEYPPVWTPLRTLERFTEQPASIRRAAWAIVSATLFAVVIGAVLVRVLAPREYPSIGRALWFTLQTVTTVGYGDVTPTSTIARLVAAVVMLVGIALITVLAAVITSTFFEAARRTRHEAEATSEELAASTRIETALVSVTERLDRIEQVLADRAGGLEATATRDPIATPRDRSEP